MKKAVIATGGKQYLVIEGQELLVEKLSDAEKSVTFEPYLVIDGDSVSIGEPTVSGSKVTATVLDAEVKAQKVLVQKFQSKKRVRSLRGHRQTHSRIKIDKISA